MIRLKAIAQFVCTRVIGTASVIVASRRVLSQVCGVGQIDPSLLPYLQLPVFRRFSVLFVIGHGDRAFSVRRRAQRMACVRVEVEGGRVRRDLRSLQHPP